MAKREISWKARSKDGLPRQVCAQRVGNKWKFFERERRFDRWQPLPEPLMEDWLTLLDGVRRRIARQLLRPEEEPWLQETIRQRFPEADV